MKNNTGKSVGIIVVAIVLVVALAAGVFFVMQDTDTDVTTLEFTLDWQYQGPQAPFIVAHEKGYFEDEGLFVAMDRGYGSAQAVMSVAAGRYDIGYGSLDALIEFNAQADPEERLVAVYMVLNEAPYSILTIENRGITKPEDLEGKKIGAPVGDAPRVLFPIFARATGIDADTVTWESMAPPLREPSLIEKDVDAITGFYFTGYLNLLAIGVPEEEIISFLYSDYGADVYGNAIVVRRDLVEENPEAIRSFLKAFNQALQEVIEDPEMGADYVKIKDPLSDRDVELQRLKLALEANILTEEVEEIGLGNVDLERLERTIAYITEAFDLEVELLPEDVFTDEFLPPFEDREI